MSARGRLARRLRPDRAVGRLGRVASDRAARCGEEALEALVAPLTPLDVERVQLIEVVHASGAIEGDVLLAVLPHLLVLSPIARDDAAELSRPETPRVLPARAVAKVEATGRRGGLRVVLALPGGEAEQPDAPAVVVLETRSGRLASVLPRPRRDALPAQPAVRIAEAQAVAAAFPAPRTVRPERPRRAETETTATRAVIVTPLEPCGYVDLDGCLRPARWDAPGARPAPGQVVLVAAVEGRLELSASEPIPQEAA